MISIICDACLARFEVSDDAAGTTVFCPKCRATNGVPAAGGGAATPGAAAGPPANASSANETLLLRVRPAMFRARPMTFLGLFILGLGGIGGGIYFFMESQPTWGITCLVASLLGWIPLGVWRVIKLATALEITNKRTVSYRGLLSKASTEVRHNDIKNFQVDQSFLNRLLGVGTIGISSSGQDEIEIQVKDLPGPYRIRELIDKHRKL